MTTFYLWPIPLPSTQQVDDLAYLFKKGRAERSMLTTFDLWKGRCRRHNLSLHWKCKIPSFDMEVDKDRCRRLNLWKLLTFHPGGGWGDMGCRKGPIWDKYVRGVTSWPQLGIASCPFWPHRFPHFGIHTSGEGGGRGESIDLCWNFGTMYWG
jgi:hypothetical protein